jgi:hypothetical protein
MRQTRLSRWSLVVFAIIGITVFPTPDGVHAFTGQAKAVQATVNGALTALADTGPLGGPGGAIFPQLDAREASLLQGTIPSLLTGDVLHATTIGWADRVASEASLGNLVLSVAGNRITADFVMARAKAVTGSAGSGASEVAGLLINGLPIHPTGAPNQQIDLAGGRVLINEQLITPAGTIVNALHVIVDGVVDVVIASANASP